MKHKRIYTILANVNKTISTKNATQDELEEGARNCEMFGEIYPVLFPEETITRKQHVFTWVFPKSIREGSVYMTMKIEQAGENIHAKFNKLESKYKSQKNRGKRFFMSSETTTMKCTRTEPSSKRKIMSGDDYNLNFMIKICLVYSI